MNPELKHILDCLNKYKIRATYTAVQSAMGIPVLDRVNWSSLLGERRPYTSWIVDKTTGLPTGYTKDDMHPDLESSSKILTKGRQVKEVLEGKQKVHVADCHGNNCAVICPGCGKAYVVSGFLNKGVRSCPHCGESKAVFKEVKAEWDSTHREAIIESEQEAARLIFKKEWLGYDVWVTFTEDGVTYRYPHDQLLQTLISRLGIIENTKSWKQNGLYHFPRLSGEQKTMLQRYIVD